MCQHVIFFAERGGQRYISQCEHGTVHFVWDAVGLHLPATAFLQIAEHLLNAEAIYQAEIEETEQAHFFIQVGRMMVAVPLADFPLVVDLLREALPRVRRQEQGAPIQPPRLRFPQKGRSIVLN